MELSLLLIEKIGSMFVMMLFGFLLVKCRILRVSDSTPISKFTLYVIAPCSLVDALQIERTEDRLTGLLLALAAAIIIHIIYIVFSRLLRRPLRLSPVEECSIVFPNAGGLIIPLVAYCLGSEWVFFVCGYLVVQIVLFWTYCRRLLSGEQKADWKKILLNVNILAVAAGLILFCSGTSLPHILHDAIAGFGDAIGPLSMVVLGMLLAGLRLEQLVQHRRVFLVCFLRLLILPITVVLLFTKTGFLSLHPQAESILLISLLSASAPAASTVMQMAQLYERDAAYAGVINLVSVLLCIVTMPLIVALYQWLA